MATIRRTQHSRRSLGRTGIDAQQRVQSAKLRRGVKEESGGPEARHDCSQASTTGEATERDDD